jgi:RNA polymerase sigma-B factor
VAEIAEHVDCPVEGVLEARQAATARRAISLDQPRRNADDTHGGGLEIAIDDIGFAATENAIVLDALMRRLTQRERCVLNLRFRDDLTQAEIGVIIGTSQMHVSRIIRSALERLQVTASTRAAWNPDAPAHREGGRPPAVGQACVRASLRVLRSP